MVVVCHSIDETHILAEKLAAHILPGSVVALIGDLGTGKTTFTQGFAKALGISEGVGSPTFKLVSEYDGMAYQLYHIDAYRLEGPDDFLNIGGEEYLLSDHGVTLIEWADIIGELLPKDTVRIKFSRIQDYPESRRIEIIGIEDEI